MIDESTEVFRQSTNLVLASVVNEALEKGGWWLGRSFLQINANK
jgi:hypothetical protein